MKPGRALPVPPHLTPSGPGISAGPRRPGSIRRTSTIEATFPDGVEGETVLDGRVRDLVTRPDGDVRTVADVELRVVLDHPHRQIQQIASSPGVAELSRLVGHPAMAGHRARVAELSADALVAGTGMHRLLDDLPGATLVSGVAHRPWLGLEVYLSHKADVQSRRMTGVCAGYQEGSSALAPDGTLRWEQRRWDGEEVTAVPDPLAWHEIPEPVGPATRRSRRLDVWLEGDGVAFESFYQDSTNLPEGGRQIVHEYVVGGRARTDASGRWVLAGVEPTPRALPYPECPLTVPNAQRLLGLPLTDLRTEVLTELAGPLGCTHLNDTYRTWCDVEPLMAELAAAIR